MTLNEFIQREVDSGRIEDAECFYIGLATFKLDNGKKLKVDDCKKYLDYELKKVAIQIHFHSMGGYMLYEVELKTKEEE